LSAPAQFSLAAAVGPLDRLGVGFDGVVIALANLLQDVAHLVHLAALMQDLRMFGWPPPARTAIGQDQLQLLSYQPTPIYVAPKIFSQLA